MIRNRSITTKLSASHSEYALSSWARNEGDGAFLVARTHPFDLAEPSLDVVKERDCVAATGIKAELEPAFQLRRYAWSAKLPLSILTNFEEFAIYDCRIRPQATDKPTVARILYVTSGEYVDRWNEIAETFSHEAVLKGAFDRYAESTKAKRGTTEVDDAFLGEIETWRSLLAHDIALRNRGLTQAELNFAVQTTINRIIFLRICEDRGIEQYGRLAVLPAEKNMYQRLLHYFQQADDRYNSGLFHFRKEKGRPAPDGLTPRLTIDNKSLKQIIKQLYYPESPYEFSVLPADILGQIYEQFLGKVIRLTAGHHAVVDEKPEVKKSGGVFYTPTFIVDCIVAWTIGRLIKGKTPRQIDALRILDLACGSGSFLIAAYQCLLNWYRDYYVQDGPGKHRKELYQGPSGDWRLTATERKRILLNNIYGVDIDAQAVEVTKLSLLLKVLEGENEQSIGMSLKMFHERALPDLANNIKCGNSLIGPDFYRDFPELADVDRARINAFDWTREFPDVMAAGGFAIIIGNPPYIRIENIDEMFRPYLYAKYDVTHRFDIYVVFVLRALALLSKRGTLGFILPNKFFTASYGKGLRSYLGKCKAIARIIDFGDGQVFRDASTYTCLLFLSKTPINSITYQRAVPGRATIEMVGPELTIDAASLDSAPWRFVGADATRLSAKLETLPQLGELCTIARGLETGLDDFFVLTAIGSSSTQVSVTSSLSPDAFKIERAVVRPLVKGAVDIRRYFVDEHSRYVFFPYKHEDGTPRLLSERTLRNDFPLAWAYLRKHARILKERKGKRWYAFRRRNYDLRDGVSRLLIPSIAVRLSAAYDSDGCYHFVGSGGGGGGGYGIMPKPETKCSHLYLLGLLNSSLVDWMAKLANSLFGGGYYSFNRQYIEHLRIRPVNLKDASDRSRHDHIVTLVERMLTLHRKQTRTPHEQAAALREIAALDAQIDDAVYALYGITDAERRIVESASADTDRRTEN
ncbi:MAG TPA: N-6 DNA methylase [Terriglobales bacterium]